MYTATRSGGILVLHRGRLTAINAALPHLPSLETLSGILLTTLGWNLYETVFVLPARWTVAYGKLLPGPPALRLAVASSAVCGRGGAAGAPALRAAIPSCGSISP